jgi:hypothetical protein
MKKENPLKSTKITTSDKTMILFDSRLHSWDGPAIKYKDPKKKDEYYLYGFKKTKDEWKEAKRDWEGLPPDKNSSVKSRF